MDYFFSFQGRINRLEWWLGQLTNGFLIVFVFFGFIYFAQYSNYDFEYLLYLEDGSLNYNSIITALLVYFLFLWSTISLSVKRYHDRNKSGMWYLIIFIPYIGVIWHIIECGFLPGTDGTNEYDVTRENPQTSHQNNSYNEFDKPITPSNDIDEIIARHVKEHKYQSRNNRQHSTPMRNPKPVFGKR